MFQEQLVAKQAPYQSVAKNGSRLFQLVHRVCLLHPVYYVSAASLTYIFVQAVKSRDRGKGFPGKLYFAFFLY